MSHPTRDVWVEIQYWLLFRSQTWSHPTRDVWVEIQVGDVVFFKGTVTSHTGCVSRNISNVDGMTDDEVTSHTGCVSRNIYMAYNINIRHQSHPTRDVWVEMSLQAYRKSYKSVTSHTGCVSRNLTVLEYDKNGKSHPTRDVWVEIFITVLIPIHSVVTSHTGCVSRN